MALQKQFLQNLSERVCFAMVNTPLSLHPYSYFDSLTRFTSTVVWETAVSPKSTCGNNAIIAIGFSVFVAHMLLIPIDGCSINPARSFGPAVISYLRDCPNQSVNGLKDMWVMTVGPLAGGAFAALLALAMGANPWLFEAAHAKGWAVTGLFYPSGDAGPPAPLIVGTREKTSRTALSGPGQNADANADLPVEANHTSVTPGLVHDDYDIDRNTMCCSAD